MFFGTPAHLSWQKIRIYIQNASKKHNQFSEEKRMLLHASGLARILDTLHRHLHLGSGAHDGLGWSLRLWCQGVGGHGQIAGGHRIHRGINGLGHHGLGALVGDGGTIAIAHLCQPEPLCWICNGCGIFQKNFKIA